MADNKKFYYLKLKDVFFDSEEMRLLEAMENGFIYSNLYLKMMLKSLKFNGELMFRDGIPYDCKALAVVTGIPRDSVEKGLKVLENFGFIRRIESGAIFMMDIEKMIGADSTEAERLRDYRQRVKNKELTYEGTNVHDANENRTSNELHNKSIEIETEIEKENISSPEKPADDCQKTSGQQERPADEKIIAIEQAVDCYHEILPMLPKVREITKSRRAAFRQRSTEKTERRSVDWWEKYFRLVAVSDWLTGNNEKGFRADFEWLINGKNMLKVLEGRYENRPAKQVATHCRNSSRRRVEEVWR